MPDTTSKKFDPEGAPSGMALRRCLVEGDTEASARSRRRRRKTFGASLAIEVLLLGFFVAVPLLTSVAQPPVHRNLPPELTFLRGLREHGAAQPAGANHTLRFSILVLTPGAPVVPAQVHRGWESGDDSIPDVSGGGDIPGAMELPEAGTFPPAQPPHITPPAQPEKRPVKLSEGVQEAQLISRIEPQYPLLAIQTKTEGAVRLHAIISRDGRITSLDVVSGHPLLVKAALAAVKQWRYRPTLLNGEPVEVETSITVNFQLRP